jgi:hypothetical protein
MKKYLFGLGVMSVGAGLMFVLMHGEVSAEGEQKKPEPLVCSESNFITLDKRLPSKQQALGTEALWHCQVGNVSCRLTWGKMGNSTISCVSAKSGLFK